ncbi:MAG: carboxypeptidase-like regulatory domain-containing protein [Planctomycetota bacterium]
MSSRLVITILAVLGILLFLGAIGSYKGWFGSDEPTSASIDGAGGAEEGDGSSGRDLEAANGRDRNGRTPTGRQDGTVVNHGSSDDDGASDSDEFDPEEYFAIAGFVSTVDGVPIPGVDVEVFQYQSTLFSHQAIGFLANLENADRPIVSGVGDDAGMFQLQLPGPGRYYLRARAEGYSGSVEGPIHVHSGEPVAMLSIPLPVGYSISGRAVDHSGRELAGVSIFLMQKSDLGYSYYTHRTTSNSDGSFIFEGLEPTGYVLMVPPLGGKAAESPSAADVANGTLIPAVTAPTAGLEVRVQSGEVFKGQVVELSDGPQIPVEGASVTVLNPVSYAQALTDAAGTFEVSLTGSDANIVIEKDGFLIYEGTIVLSHGEDTFALNRGRSLSASIVFPDGDPAAHIEVGLLQPSRFLGRMQVMKTDAQGRFDLSGIDASQSLYVLPRIPGFWIPFGTPLPEEGGTFTLSPTTDLRGVVLDPTGQAIDGAWLHLVTTGNEIESRAVYWLRGEVEGWSAEDGSFHFSDVLPDAHYVLRASSEGVSDGSQTIRGVPEHDVSLVLSPGATYEFQLRTADREQPAGALLIAGWNGAPAIQRRTDGVLEGGVRFLSGSNGRIVVEHVPEGEVVFYLLCAGYVEQRLERTVKADEFYSEEIEFQVSGELIVTLRDSAGEPVPMAWVRVSELGGGSFSQRRRSGPLGVAAFGSLPPGRYRVSCSEFRTETLEISGDAIELEMVPNG